MKKLLTLILALVMLFALSACGDDTPATTPAATEPAATQPAATEPGAEDPVVTEPAAPEYPTFEFTQYGNAKVSIVGAELAKDEYDEPFLRVYYDYTNTGDTAAGQEPDSTLNFQLVTQDGNEIEEFGMYSDDPNTVPEDLMENVSIQPGVTLRKTRLFEIDPEGGVVDFSCYVMVGSWMYNPDDVELMKFQLDPADLPGAPEEALEIPEITDPNYTAGLPTSGTADSAVPYCVSLDGVEQTTWDDLPALRVKMTYTNLASEAWPPCVVLPINVYQDGYSLEMVSSWYLDEVTEADEAFENDVEPNVSTAINAIFLLRGTNPVEVVIEKPNVEMRIGAAYNIP